MADKTYKLKKAAEDIDATLNFALRYDIAQSLTAPEKARVLASLGINASKLDFKILSYFDSFEELQAAITAPEPGDAYGVGMSYPYDIYIWDAMRGRWVNNGPIRGADGEDGKDAELTAEGIVDALGYVPADADEPISFERLEKNAKTIAFENISVPDWAWEEVGTSQQYPWRAAIELPGSGVDANWEPSIVFDDESLLAAEFARRCESFENGVFIFAAAVPESLILIKTLSLTHCVIEAYTSSVFASISVTYAAGATLTCTDGTTTLTAKSTSGKWTFAIPYAGTWLISDGDNEQSVRITTAGQAVSVVLGRVWDGTLFDTGDEWSEITGGWVFVAGQSANTAGIVNNKIRLKGVGNNAVAYATTAKEIDFSGHSKLNFAIDWAAYEWHAIDVRIYNAEGSLIKTTTISSTQATTEISGNSTYSINLTDITSGYPRIRASGGGTNGVADTKTTKVWLE